MKEIRQYNASRIEDGNQNYCMLVQDDDCHWYIIPVAKKADFEKWAASYNDWDEPGYAVGVDGPHSVHFKEFTTK